MTAASTAATVSTAASAAGMSGASAAAGMFAAPAASAAIAGPPATARRPSVVSGRIAAEPTRVRIAAVAPIDVGRVVARSPTPITATASPAWAVTTRRQSCEEQRCEDRHFSTTDKSYFHFDKPFSAWRLTNDTKIPVFNSEAVGDCAASGHLEQTIGAERPSRVPAGRDNQDCRDRQLRISTAAANQVVAVAAGFKPQLSNRGWIVNQLDAYKVEAGFQSFPRKRADHTEPNLAIPFATRPVSDFGPCAFRPPPAYRRASINSEAHQSDARRLAHSWNRRAWRPARPSVVPGESRTFRAPIAPDARSLLAARRRPGWRCPYG